MSSRDHSEMLYNERELEREREELKLESEREGRS